MKGSTAIVVGVGIIAGNVLLYRSLQRLYETGRQEAVVLIGLLVMGLACAIAVSAARVTLHRLVTALLVSAAFGVALQFLPAVKVL